MRNRKGFTLMELMIVLIIIGILVTIALPVYVKVVEKSKMAEAINTLGAIRQSEYRYYMQKGFSTPTPTDLDVGDPSTVTMPGQTIRYSNYVITGATIDVLVYSCDRNTTVNYTSAFGLPATGYKVNMDANGNVSTAPAF